MLSKLLKYDLKAIYKYLVFFYLIAFLCAGIGRLFNTFSSTTFTFILSQIFSGFAIGFSIGAVINNCMQFWEYFKKDFYGDKSYLTHTLPLPSKTLFLSKFITVLITSFTTVAAVILTLLTLYGTPTFFEQVGSFTSQLSTFQVVAYSIILFFLLVLELVCIILAGATGLIIGHKSNTHKIFKSVIFGFAFYLAMGAVLLVGLLILACFNTPTAALLTSNTLSSPTALLPALLTSTIIYAVLAVAFYFLDVRLLEKGINID